uniref:NADH-cytochrome b5 reductase n=1 Tax=Opuntia streptacantha TaxID=393608 RepID=A0A7C9CH21_OPUST
MSFSFRKLAKAAPAAFAYAVRGSHKFCSYSSGFPYGAIAAISSGLSLFYYTSSPNLAYLDPINEEAHQKVALNPDKWVEFKLQETANVTHNTKLFRFTFDPDAKLGLYVASCILTRAPIGQEDEGKTKYVIRPYTPISDPDAKGYFDLMIKIYPEGKMSQHFAKLKPGDVVEVKGPIEKLRYTPNMKKHIGMIAGGTGITPMLQIIEAIMKNPGDNTQVSLLYANVSPDDILLKKKLDILAESHSNFKVYYTVDNPSKDWKGGVGYVSKDMVIKGLPGPGADTLILVCGPPGMMKHVSGDKAEDRSQGELSGILKECGYTEEMVYKF